MGPIVKDTAKTLADKPIVFVTFDFTTAETRRDGAAKADALGVPAEIYQGPDMELGVANVFDTSTKAVVTTLTAKNDSAEWVAVLTKALGDS